MTVSPVVHFLAGSAMAGWPMWEMGLAVTLGRVLVMIAVGSDAGDVVVGVLTVEFVVARA